MKTKVKIYFLLLLSINCACIDKRASQEKQYAKAKNFSEKFNNLPYYLLKNWEISQRQDSLYIFDHYNDSKYIGGFLIKIESGLFIKAKSNELNSANFLKFQDYPEAKLSDIRATKKEILEIINILKNVEPSKISYINSLEILLIEKQKFSIVYLLSSKHSNDLPKSYKKISKNWYYLSTVKSE